MKQQAETMGQTILITRPKGYGEDFAKRLRQQHRDVECILSPLLQIEYLSHLPDLAPYRGLVFTSVNGVVAACRLTERRDLPCFVVGEATARYARSRGFEATYCGDDAATMLARWEGAPPQGPLLHLRGKHARVDLAAKLSAMDCPTASAILYHQALLPLNNQARAALEREKPVIVPLFSPRTAAQFRKEHRGAAPLFIAAFSDAVAGELADMPLYQCAVSKRPQMSAMLDAVSELINAARRLEGAEDSR